MVQSIVVRIPNRKVMVSCLVTVLLMTGLLFLNIRILSNSVPRHTDTDLYSEMYQLFLEKPQMQNQEIWFCDFIYNHARQGELYSLTFTLQKFGLTARYLDIGQDPPMEITKTKDRIPVELTEQPKYLFVSRHYESKTDRLIELSTTPVLAHNGRHFILFSL